METLYWHYGFSVLVRKNWVELCKSNLLWNARYGFLSMAKSMLTTPTQLKPPSPACINHSRTFGLFIAYCSASDLAISEIPYLEENLGLYFDSTSVSFQSIHFQNDQLWSALEIAEALDGKIISWGPSGTISTDTRKLMPGQWFFALSGESFNGHDFIDEALADEKGCIGVIGNRVCKNWRRGFIKVEGDTMIALEKMATYARKRFHGTVIGLTGSVGKTTTRTMIALALENLGRVYQTRGNLNYMVGVALTLIGIPLDVETSVVELGMGGLQGEILKMTRMCRPSVRVVLNVGHCHMEHFRTLDEVATAKGELLVEAEPGNVCVLNADDPLVMSIPVPSGVRKVLFGRSAGCDVRLVLAEHVDGGCAIRVILESRLLTYDIQSSAAGEETDMAEFKILSPGLHLAMDACAAAAVAISLGVSLPQIGKALSRFRPVHMRSEMEVAKNGITIINDTYNANIISMIAAIKSLESMACRGQRVAILGDMLELGTSEARAHEMVLELCYDSFIGLIMLAGKRFLAAAEKLNLMGKSNIICMPNSTSLVPKVSELLAAGDVVWVKGSRGMEMEKVVEAIKVIRD